MTGTNWHPEAIAKYNWHGQLDTTVPNIRNYSIFELTWDGLYLNLGKATYEYINDISGNITKLLTPITTHPIRTSIGFTENRIYNTWTGSIPWYDNDASSGTPDFAKVISVSDSQRERIAIYDDGTLVADKALLEGGTIGSWVIDSKKLYHATTGQNDGMGLVAENGNEIQSLWREDETSPVVIYSGSNSDIWPDPIPDPNTPEDLGCYFAVLQDGSVYASAIKLRNADMESGNIGNMKVESNIMHSKVGTMLYNFEYMDEYGNLEILDYGKRFNVFDDCALLWYIAHIQEDDELPEGFWDNPYLKLYFDYSDGYYHALPTTNN